MLETELQPLMEQTLSKRSNERVHKIWLQIYNQLLDYKTWDSGPTSSLYGTQSTASLLAGDRMKRFARVRSRDMQCIGACMHGLYCCLGTPEKS